MTIKDEIGVPKDRVSIVRLTRHRYLLAALATALALAGCTTVTGAGKASGSTGTSPATGAQAAGNGTSAASSPAAPGGLVATASAAGQGAAVPECTAADLQVTESAGNGAVDTASGHAALALRFTNTGSLACYLQGYPGVAVSGPGGVLNAQRAMGGDAGRSPSPVTVPAGRTASALLEWLFFPQDGSAAVTTGNCPGYHAARLLVTAPDQTTSTVFTAPDTATPVCWGFEVNPVVPGATGRSSS